MVYQWKFKREQHDNKAINAMVTKAEKVADGTRPMRRDRFVKVTGVSKGVDWDLVERARQLAGLKGYVTNLPAATMDSAAVIAAYHGLWRVEQSFRMTKSDLRARLVFHHQRDAIEARLTVVFAALAVARHLQDATDVTIKKLVRTLRPVPCHNSFTIAELVLRAPQAALRYSLIKPWTTCLRLIRPVTSTG